MCDPLPLQSDYFLVHILPIWPLSHASASLKSSRSRDSVKLQLRPRLPPIFARHTFLPGWVEEDERLCSRLERFVGSDSLRQGCVGSTVDGVARRVPESNPVNPMDDAFRGLN